MSYTKEEFDDYQDLLVAFADISNKTMAADRKVNDRVELMIKTAEKFGPKDEDNQSLYFRDITKTGNYSDDYFGDSINNRGNLRAMDNNYLFSLKVDANTLICKVKIPEYFEDDYGEQNFYEFPIGTLFVDNYEEHFKELNQLYLERG